MGLAKLIKVRILYAHIKMCVYILTMYIYKQIYRTGLNNNSFSLVRLKLQFSKKYVQHHIFKSEPAVIMCMFPQSCCKEFVKMSHYKKYLLSEDMNAMS